MSIFPSNHHEEVMMMARRDVKDSWKWLLAGKKSAGAKKAPEIAWTTADPQKEDHEPYSPPLAAAIRTS
jgi:hypothetical protein